MNKKEIAKKYLIFAFLLFFIGTGFLFLFISALVRMKDGITLTPQRVLLMSALCSLVPLGSFTGFVAAGTKIKELKTSHAALIVVLYPLFLVAVTVYGVIMIIPEIIISIRNLVRG